MSDNKTFSYDTAIAEVEHIVEKLENNSNGTKFDDLIADVQKAMKLIADCRKNLAQTEAKVEQICATDKETI